MYWTDLLETVTSASLFNITPKNCVRFTFYEQLIGRSVTNEEKDFKLKELFLFIMKSCYENNDN